jgi:hypothetical protein
VIPDQFGEAARSPVVPDAAEPVLAWRAWHMMYEGAGFQLSSLSKNIIWPPDGLRAECLCSEFAPWLSRRNRHRKVPGLPHPSPDIRGYGCGIYGMRSYEIFAQSSWGSGVPVHGAVHLGGRVWRHELGWRAEYAKVVYLVRMTSSDDALRELARRYEVPVLTQAQARLRGVTP